MDLTQFEKTGTDSWSAGWCYESDVINSMRRELGDKFPKRYTCFIKEDGEFSSGKPKYLWVLTDATNEEGKAVITTRSAIKLTSRKGKQYIQVRRYADKPLN
jgi:hypothetical protein